MIALSLALGITSGPAIAQATQGSNTRPRADGNDSEPKTLDAVVVTGTVSGPGMWQVYKDDEHDLWVFGIVKPLPAKSEWDSTTVKDTIRRSQEVLWYPGYAVDIQSNVFQQALLGYSYLRAKNNPGGKSLSEVLEPSLYARWALLKGRYMPHNAGVERKRPLIAA